MKAYVVLVVNCQKGTSTISQDAYQTFEQAKKFIMNRSDYNLADEWNEHQWFYVTENGNIYNIKEITIKGVK
jgi:hypothetical protein